MSAISYPPLGGKGCWSQWQRDKIEVLRTNFSLQLIPKEQPYAPERIWEGIRGSNLVKACPLTGFITMDWALVCSYLPNGNKTSIYLPQGYCEAQMRLSVKVLWGCEVL